MSDQTTVTRPPSLPRRRFTAAACQGKILLVDDDREIVLGLSIRLRAAGFETSAAHDGEHVAEIAKEYKPRVIILDVRMPIKDGIQCLEELRQSEQTREIPIIMLSASIEDQQRALDAGARFYLTKPYDGKDLIAAINAAMGEAQG